MENCNRTEPSDLRWLFALCAAVGTVLLAFVPGERWLNAAKTPDALLSHIFLKQMLTLLLLAVVPSLWARTAHCVSPWMLVPLTGIAFGSGLLLNGGAVSALYTVLLIALPGVGLYVLQRLRLSNFRTVLYSSFLILAALFGYACLPDLIRYGDAYRPVKALLDLYEQVLTGMASELESVQIVSALQSTFRLYRMNAESIGVPMLLTAAMTAALGNTLFSHLWNRKGGAELTPLPKFENWRCERWYVILAALFSLATILLWLFGVRSADALSSVAEVLFRIPCALAGLCAVRRLGLRVGRGWILWPAVAALVLLPPAAILILTVLGMLSSLRKQTNVGEDGIRK